MQTKVKWIDGAMMIGESQSGHAVVMDGPEAFGGRNIGIRPMEMLLIGLGGCTTFDVVSILKKTKQDLISCGVEIKAKRADIHPKIFTDIHIHFIIKGNNIEEKKVAKAIDLSANKYCSASQMLASAANITHDFEIIK